MPYVSSSTLSTPSIGTIYVWTNYFYFFNLRACDISYFRMLHRTLHTALFGGPPEAPSSHHDVTGQRSAHPKSMNFACSSQNSDWNRRRACELWTDKSEARRWGEVFVFSNSWHALEAWFRYQLGIEEKTKQFQSRETHIPSSFHEAVCRVCWIAMRIKIQLVFKCIFWGNLAIASLV